MKYVEAPEIYSDTDCSLFLAGGITGCSDWQSDMVKMLAETSLVLLNPRRQDFPIHDPSAAEAQITWEHRMLKHADAVSFWFPPETLCPIVLFELGSCLAKAKKLFIGVDPNYQRRRDIEIQTKLAAPEIEIVYSLQDLAHQILRLPMFAFNRKACI